MNVGIRELKNNLSRYLGKVREGDRLAVTDRGTVVAYVVPASDSPGIEGLLRLVKEERASWGGGKPEGAESPEKARGKAVSEIVLEERR